MIGKVYLSMSKGLSSIELRKLAVLRDELHLIEDKLKKAQYDDCEFFENVAIYLKSRVSILEKIAKTTI